MAALTLAFVEVQPSFAAIVTVDTLTDEYDGSCSDGDCSLRDAIQVANSGDTINLVLPA
jgi:CSLREA domain-containing protein